MVRFHDGLQTYLGGEIGRRARLKILLSVMVVTVRFCSGVQNGGLAQLARASALHAEGHRFDSDILHIVTIRKNGGTDAKYEMETWGNPDTNRTAVTKLICRSGGKMIPFG